MGPSRHPVHLVGALLGALGAACGMDVGPPAQGLAPPWSPVADASLGARCTDCHPDLVRDWRATGMARALGPVSAAEFEGLGEAQDGAGFRYGFAARGERVGQVETWPASGAGHHLEAELVFAIGAGRLDRSYAARLGRLLWFAPLEVVVEDAGRRAVLAPGHAIAPGLRFTTPITPECLGCHTDAPPPADFPLNRVPDSWTPRGISCAACHGDTHAHADWHDADLAGREPPGEDPVLRVGELSRIERVSVCAACHLQGDARIVLEPGALGPPAPGGDLLDVRALFVAREPSRLPGFVSQVERLVESACFRAAPQLDCTTCHDPHRSLDEVGEREAVRAACLTCHEDGRGRGAGPGCTREVAAGDGDCASCHLPRTGVFDVERVEIHDHWIRVPGPSASRAAAPVPRIPESPEGDWRRFTWPGEAPPAHLDDPGLWAMALAHGGHVARALEYAVRAPGPVAAGLPMFHHVRGRLLEQAGRDAEAEDAYRRALELDPASAPSAINLGLSLGRRDPRAGRDLLDAVLERYPDASGALRNRAVLASAAGDLPQAARDLALAFEIEPRADLAASLARLFERVGDGAAAAHWRALAHTLDPRAER